LSNIVQIKCAYLTYFGITCNQCNITNAESARLAFLPGHLIIKQVRRELELNL
jgi:hypothetical protein